MARNTTRFNNSAFYNYLDICEIENERIVLPESFKEFMKIILNEQIKNYMKKNNSLQIESESKALPKSVVKLIKLIFDKEEIENYMKKNNFDSNSNKFLRKTVTNQEYSRVCPSTDRFMKDDYKIMREISIDQNTFYHYYKKLNTKICSLDLDSSECHNILTYVKNSHSPKHNNYTLQVNNIFSISKNGAYTKYKKYKKLGDRKLLWHGSRITNFASILSKGLQIEPKDVPKTGSMFGKGIYFTDVISKSANYCKATKDQPYGLLLLAEVALGKNKIWHNRDKDGTITELPEGYNSVKGVGQLVTDRKTAIRNKYGVKIPLGNLIPNKYFSPDDLYLRYNEYVVYDTNQFLLQYLVLVKFHFK